MKSKSKKQNYYFILFLIPFILFCQANQYFDNDIWFLLNSGRYVLNHGIPYIEPFTIHQGLAFLMPQWLSAVIFYFLYHHISKLALYFFIIFLGMILLFAYYKLCYIINKNKTISILLSTIFGILISSFIVTRPQTSTYLLLIIELLCLEKYKDSHKQRYLYILPFLSLLEINLHASMWLLLFAFLLPYIIEEINFKSLKITIKNIKPYLLVILLMILFGLINPYYYDAFFYIFRSYGISEINSLILEMQIISLQNLKIVIVGILVILMINNYKNKNIPYRYYFLLLGCTYLAIQHNKCYPYFFISLFTFISALLKDIKVSKKALNKYYIAIQKGLGIACSCILCFITIYSLYIFVPRVITTQDNNSLKDTVDYLEQNYNLNDIQLYINYNNGGYTEYRGIKSYIDPRAEVFLKRNNKKEDIFLEYYELQTNKNFDYQSFLEKYNFTHLIVTVDDNFDKFLADSNQYENIYTQINKNGQKVANLYVKR